MLGDLMESWDCSMGLQRSRVETVGVVSPLPRQLQAIVIPRTFQSTMRRDRPTATARPISTPANTTTKKAVSHTRKSSLFTLYRKMPSL